MPASPDAAQQTRTTRFRLVFAALAGAALAGAFSMTGGDRAYAGPTTRWTVDGEVDPEPFTVATPDSSRVAVELELPARSWVYAITFDMGRGTIALFPSTTLRTDVPANPLPAGRYRLPGSHDGKTLHWPTGGVIGPVSFTLIVSPVRLADLETVLATCRQMGNAAFPGRVVLDPYAPAGGMEVTPPTHAVPHSLLESAARTVHEPDGRMTPFAVDGRIGHMATLHLRHDRPGTERGPGTEWIAAPRDRDETEAMIQERLQKALEGSPASVAAPGGRPPK